MKTHISTLDKLLGVNLDSELDEKVPETQAMLIRGAPGSGKTTLALQILAKHVTKKPANYGIFLSLEVNPQVAWDAVVARLSPELWNELSAFDKNNEAPEKNITIYKTKNKRSKLLLVSRDWLNEAIPYAEWHTVDDRLTNKLQQLVDESFGTRGDNDPKTEAEGLIVVDSVNLLADMVQHKISSPDKPADMRTVMFGIWSILEKQKHRPLPPRTPCNLVLIGEHHPGVAYDVSLLSESFACDIELLLAPEPIAGKPDIPANMLGPLGYSFERRLHAKPLSDEPQSVEIRSFCRVLKSRFSPNESRRCAYDIESGNGVVFTETYPGDGALLLFHENSRQKEVWETFLARDVPLQFPALRYNLFDPKGVQRTFATQRRFQQLHQKTDMYLASFDTYWVNWYWQLGQRSQLRSLIKAAFPEVELLKDEEARKTWSRFLCGVDDFATEALRKYPIGQPVTMGFLKEFLKKTEEFSLSEWITSITIQRAATPEGHPRIIKRIILQQILQASLDLKCGEIGLLQPVIRNRLRLFGERRSDIIKELKRPDNRVHLLDWKDDNDVYLSVPYNANVSFLVYRPDMLEDYRKKAMLGSTKWEASLNKLNERQRKALTAFRQMQEEHFLKKRKSKEWDYVNKQEDRPMPIGSCAVKPLTEEEQKDADRRDDNMKSVLNKGVKTWEELILLCLEGEVDTVDTQDKPSAHFVIETRTPDSFLCALLEIFWSFGGEMRINPQYEFIDFRQTEQRLFQAFYLLHVMFRVGIIERDSTLDPKEFARRFPGQPPPSMAKNDNKEEKKDWLFARHWYSSLVNILTDEKENKIASGDNKTKVTLPIRIQDEKPSWTWRPHNMELNIQPLPISGFANEEQNKVVPRPVSCWGEWHFAVLNGSENQELAIELLNNMMSSNAICERAAYGAAVPTVEEFYNHYASVPCLRLPERSDINMPKMTYQELRDCIFDVARSRQPIFDHQHCMREIHSVLTFVQHIPATFSDEEAIKQLAEQVLTATDRIHLLQNYNTLG